MFSPYDKYRVKLATFDRNPDDLGYLDTLRNAAGSALNVASPYVRSEGDEPRPRDYTRLSRDMRELMQREDSTPYITAGAPALGGLAGLLLGAGWRKHRLLGGSIGALLGGAAGAMIPIGLRRGTEELNTRVGEGATSGLGDMGPAEPRPTT